MSGIYPAGWKKIGTATGAEQIEAVNGGATIVYLTAQQIANLAGTGKVMAITALNTVGAGTITAAGIVGGISKRGGAQSNTAFTDTTDTGANLDAALADAQIGQDFLWSYQNTTDAIATLSGGTGVTVSGITTVGPGTTATFLVTRTAAATYTVVGFEATAPTGSSKTFVCNGVTPVTVAASQVTANSAIVITLKTVGGTVGAIPAIQTITPGTGFTVAGTASDTSTYNVLIIG